jgi:hypothetical protein
MLMAVYDVFSKREMRQQRKSVDVFVYDELPPRLRVQLANILRYVIGNPDSANAYQHYETINDAMCHELGRFWLAERGSKGAGVLEFVRRHENVKEVLDVVEMALNTMEHVSSGSYRHFAGATAQPSEAAEEINQRFLENGIGYQYENGQMMRLDSQFAHSEIVKPALLLLSDTRYTGPEEEFLKAHKHYREGNYKECIVDCLKAFESTMKAICDIRGWTYNSRDTAKALIDICIQNGLIDSMLLAHVGALRTVLEAGVPTLRNKRAGHGQGATPVTVPAHYAAYALHLTAANIVFFVTAEKNL